MVLRRLSSSKKKIGLSGIFRSFSRLMFNNVIADFEVFLVVVFKFGISGFVL